MHKSVVVPAVTGGEGEGMSLNQYYDPLKGRSIGSVDLDEIDEYTKRALRADREIVKDQYAIPPPPKKKHPERQILTTS